MSKRYEIFQQSSQTNPQSFVYALMAIDEYDNDTVLGIFSTAKDATQFAMKQTQNIINYGDCWVDKHPLL